MDLLQHVFEYVVGLLFAVGAWLWKSLIVRVDKLESKVDTILTSELKDLRLEIKTDLKDLKNDIRDVSNKLDNKEDKHRS